MKTWERGSNSRLSSDWLSEHRIDSIPHISDCDSLSTNIGDTSSCSSDFVGANMEGDDPRVPHGGVENQNMNGGMEHAHGQRTLREMLLPGRNASPSCIIYPPDATNFHFRNGMIQLLPIFRGMESERAYLHVRDFEEVCATFNDQNCQEDTIKLKLFSFSLKDKAKVWFNALRPQSIHFWQELQ